MPASGKHKHTFLHVSSLTSEKALEVLLLRLWEGPA